MNRDDPTDATMKDLKRRLADLGWYHSIEIPGKPPIAGLQSAEQLRTRLAQFPIPTDLRDKRVLDIGAWDGWFSFEMERRGAKVVAIDNAEHHRFREARKLLDSSVEYVSADICRVNSKDLGSFDYVLFFGVLYHLKHPLLALENVCELATEAAFVESYVSDSSVDPDQKPIMEFYEGTELAGQFDNWVGPNVACLLALCRAAGFARVELQSVLANRAHVSCFRKSPHKPQATSADLVIVTAENAIDRSQQFQGTHDEYVTIYFKSGETPLDLDAITAEIGPYSSRPVHLTATGGDGYALNCKLPPGLRAGRHPISLATARGISANRASLRIGADIQRSDGPVPGASGPLRVQTVADGISWSREEISIGGQGGFLSLWAENVPEGIQLRDVLLLGDGIEMPASFVSAIMDGRLTQINFNLPAEISVGPSSFRLSVRGGESASFDVRLARIKASLGVSD